MANVFDVAHYVLHKKGSMSTWKLQKLCFYCQAWSLAWTEAPLFSEDFEAWANGPVCPALFFKHKGKYMVSESGIPEELGDGRGMDDDQQDTVDKVLEYYGDWEPFELREQTHNEAPWLAARAGLSDGARCNEIISKESMGEYYGSL